MILLGHFENGAIVLDQGEPLPDGTAVRIRSVPTTPEAKLSLTNEMIDDYLMEDEVLSVIAPQEPQLGLLKPFGGPRMRVVAPLVPSDNPESIHHTPEEIREFLNDDQHS